MSRRMMVLGRSMGALALALALAGAACDDGGTGNTPKTTPDATTTQDSSTSTPDTGTTAPDAAADAVAVDPPVGSPPPGGKCDYVAIDQGGGKAFGEACTKNADCAWGECLEPSEGGNLTNELFGFCTRGCDCGTSETTLSAADKETLMCLYPPGNQRKWAHVVVRCTSVADCQALDPRWTACRLPTSGGVQAICHADAL